MKQYLSKEFWFMKFMRALGIAFLVFVVFEICLAV